MSEESGSSGLGFNKMRWWILMHSLLHWCHICNGNLLPQEELYRTRNGDSFVVFAQLPGRRCLGHAQEARVELSIYLSIYRHALNYQWMRVGFDGNPIITLY